VIDARTYEVLDFVLVGRRVWPLAFDENERHIYSTNGISGDVTIINVASLRPIKTLKVGRFPWGAAFRPDWTRLSDFHLWKASKKLTLMVITVHNRNRRSLQPLSEWLCKVPFSGHVRQNTTRGLTRRLLKPQNQHVYHSLIPWNIRTRG